VALSVGLHPSVSSQPLRSLSLVGLEQSEHVDDNDYQDQTIRSGVTKDIIFVCSFWKGECLFYDASFFAKRLARATIVNMGGSPGADGRTLESQQ